ncbi:GPI inositol-deacylase isoform X2 [Nilaparvata lugens]|uniref:GPI inositol-deacylase isoform X2 n=1 Tax=Nilaparvata lugens TaxID=108931 RepID=UPI00193D4302|nr:GPI inositol-deacylase isoform X2 [Nilaparvata lugens]
MAVVNGLIAVCLSIFLLYLVGLKGYLKIYRDNKCEMTYMFEYPQYVRISLPLNVSFQFRRYGLFAYSEGRYTERAREMKFNGIPVLFIPGNSGSLKQVRSLASVSLRKSLSSHAPFHFDFFSVDLNEEYMGLFGGFLNDQTRFVHHCIERIFALYKRNKPDSIVIIGHSMGGLIAKGLYLDPEFDSSRVRLMISLATPHSPALLLDSYMADYYERLADLPSLDKSVTLISVGGGIRDRLIRSGLTYTRDAHICITSTQVPDVWLSTDHLSILWCKQLVLVLVRALFDSVDLNTKQISADPKYRERVFNYHLISRTAGKSLSTSQHPEKVQLWDGVSRPGAWLKVTDKQQTVAHPGGVNQPTHHIIPLYELRQQRSLLDVLSVNHRNKDWLFACKATKTNVKTGSGNGKTVAGNGKTDGDELLMCTWADNLSPSGRIAPTKHLKRKVARLDLTELRKNGHTHVVARILPTSQPVRMYFDMHGFYERTVTPPSLPRWISPIPATLVHETTPKSVRYTIALPGLHSIWQAYRVLVETVNCSQIEHQTVISLVIPWGAEGISKVFLTDRASLPIRLQSAKPVTSPPIMDPFIDLTLDPVCTYAVHIESSIFLSLGQMARFYSPLIVTSVTTILLLTLRHQLHCLGNKQKCPLFMTALVTGAKPYYVIPVAKILSHLGRSRFVAHLPLYGVSSLHELGIDFVFLPILLYAIGLAVTYMIGVGTYVGIVASGQAVNKLVMRFLGRLMPGWSDWVMSGLSKVPLAVAVFMVALCHTASAGLALTVGAVFYFIKVCSLYDDYLEQLMMWPLKIAKRELFGKVNVKKEEERRALTEEEEKEEKEDSTTFDELQEMFDLTEINYHITVMLIWSTATLIHIPSVLVWAHNYRYNTKLEPDPAWWNGIILSICAGVLWQGNLPRMISSTTKNSGMLCSVWPCSHLPSLTFRSIGLVPYLQPPSY